MFSVSAIAHEKVVVVPMGSSAKGTDGQVQYNDDGKTAGAEVFYDKATGKLEVLGELRTLDGAGDIRQWGKGRQGTTLLEHIDPNGYCTTAAGINYALSRHTASWYDVAEVCPAGTWVCRQSDMPTIGSCSLQTINTFQSINCNGSTSVVASQTEFKGFLDDTTSSINLDDSGMVIFSGDVSVATNTDKCFQMRAWCCWE